MRVLYITTGNPLNSNGAGANRLLGLLHNLADNGVEVSVLLINFSMEKTICQNIFFDSVPNCSKLMNIFPVFIQKEINTYVLTRNVRRNTENKVNAIDPDIIWFDRTMPSQRLLLKLKKVFRDIVFFIELSEFLDIHKVQKVNPVRSFIEDLKMNYFTKKAVKKYDSLALMTRTLYQYFKTELIDQDQALLHLPMTVDLSRFKKEIPQHTDFKKPYVAFVGVMNNIKDGVDILINAFSQISVEFPHNLYLVGPWQPDTPGHLNQIKSLGLESKVKWMKTYPREEIPSILMNAELLVLPRPDSKQAQGGFPTKLGEYLATGKPVCATSVGEIPDYLTDGESVFFAEPGNVDSFADTMRRALQNPKEAARVGQNGRKVAENEFNSSIQAKKLKVFFEQLVKSKEE